MDKHGGKMNRMALFKKKRVALAILSLFILFLLFNEFVGADGKCGEVCRWDDFLNRCICGEW
jgi:hypothetical protein